MPKQLPTSLPATMDIRSNYENSNNRFVFLSHEVNPLEDMEVMETFARFCVDGSVTIVASRTTYIDSVAGSEITGATHEHQLINISHDEMTKLAETWLQWLDENPEEAPEPDTDSESVPTPDEI